MLEAGPELGERQRRQVVDEDDAVRVAHRHTGHPVGLAGDLERALDHLAVGSDGDRATLPDRQAHVDRDPHDPPVRHLGVDGLHARVGLDAERRRPQEPPVVDELREATNAVATHLCPAAVGVVDDHSAVGVSVARRQDEDEPVRTDPTSTVAETGRERGGVAGESLARVDVDEVVRGPVEFGEAERGHSTAFDPYLALRRSVNRAQLHGRGGVAAAAPLHYPVGR